MEERLYQLKMSEDGPSLVNQFTNLVKWIHQGERSEVNKEIGSFDDLRYYTDKLSRILSG